MLCSYLGLRSFTPHIFSALHIPYTKHDIIRKTEKQSLWSPSHLLTFFALQYRLSHVCMHGLLDCAQANEVFAFVPSVTNAGAYTIRPYKSPNMCLSYNSQVLGGGVTMPAPAPSAPTSRPTCA